MVSQETITIRKERFYPHPPEDVWAAITDPHALAEWLEPNDHKPIVGHKFQFRCDPGVCGPGVTDCEVIEAAAPKRLVWSWVHTPKPPAEPCEAMTITWTLSAEQGGTLLILEHTGAENIKWLPRTMMRFGWGYMMRSLIMRVLKNVENGEFLPGAIPLNKRCYSCKTVPDEFVR